MPDYVVERVALALNHVKKPVNGSKICILGVAYKRDVDDPRESPSFELMELLAARGAKLSYSDPHIPRLPKMRHYDLPEMTSSKLTKEYLAEQDCVLIVTDHSSFDYPFIVENSRLIVDTRNALGAAKCKSRIGATIVKA
jgi:UDP-N-acetyl-D-glucosamine dehydrogenase